ncbi:hypothetical protein KC345_g6279 [Hortaea werneckii]|nr:hypothetical protein KC345_g6279 [Hortaea werneckii]
MARGSAASSQRNVGGGPGRPRFPRSSRGGPRRPLQDRHYSPSTDEEGSDHDSAKAERRQPASTDEEGSDHDSAESQRRQPASTDEEGSEHDSAEAERRQSTSTGDEGSEHDSAEAEGNNDRESRERSQTRPTSQTTSVDEEGSNHDPAEAEENSDNEGRRRSQTRPNSNDQRFARAAHVFETRVRSAWNRFELDGFPRDGTSPTPIVETGSTAIYHSPSILQFYFTNTPPEIRTQSYTDHHNDNRASSVSNTQDSPGGDTQNPRKRKRSEEDDEDEDAERQGAADTVPADNPSDNRAPDISNTQPSSGGDAQNPRKRKRSEEDDNGQDPETQGAVDTLLALIDAGMLSRDDREIMMAALENANLQGDEEVERGGEGESNDDEIEGYEEVEEIGEGNRDAQEDEGVSGKGERALDDVEMPGDEGVSGDVERQAHTQESPDGDTIVVAGASNHQSGIQEDGEDITRGRSLARVGGHRHRGAGSSGSEEDLYGSSVSPSGRRQPVTHEDRGDQPVADDGANHSEEEEGDELPTDYMHETRPRPHGRPTSGRTSHGSWSYESGAEMTTVGATVDPSNILSDAADGRRLSQQSHQNSVAANGHAEGAGHAVSAQRHVEERRASTRRSSHRASRVESIVPRESPLKQSSVPRQEERGPSPQDSQADTRTRSRTNRGVQDSPQKQRAALPSIPEEPPMGRPHIPTPHNPVKTSKRKRPTGSDRMPARPPSLSPASQNQDMAAMGIRRMSTRSSPEEEEEGEGGEGVPETISEERSSGGESGDDDAAGSGEKKTASAVNNRGFTAINHMNATEEAEVGPVGSEGSASPLSSLPSELAEERSPVERPTKRQKTRRHGRGYGLYDYGAR